MLCEQYRMKFGTRGAFGADQSIACAESALPT